MDLEKFEILFLSFLFAIIITSIVQKVAIIVWKVVVAVQKVVVIVWKVAVIVQKVAIVVQKVAIWPLQPSDSNVFKSP